MTFSEDSVSDEAPTLAEWILTETLRRFQSEQAGETSRPMPPEMHCWLSMEVAKCLLAICGFKSVVDTPLLDEFLARLLNVVT